MHHLAFHIKWDYKIFVISVVLTVFRLNVHNKSAKTKCPNHADAQGKPAMVSDRWWRSKRTNMPHKRHTSGSPHHACGVAETCANARDTQTEGNPHQACGVAERTGTCTYAKPYILTKQNKDYFANACVFHNVSISPHPHIPISLLYPFPYILICTTARFI